MLSAVYIRIDRGESAISFQTSRYKRFLSSGELFSTAKTLRLIQGRRNADLPTATMVGFKRLLTPENNLPSAMAVLARFKNGSFTGASLAKSSVVFNFVGTSWRVCELIKGRTIIINKFHSLQRSNIQHEPPRSAPDIDKSHGKWPMA